jgi:peptide/nickel transport system ATP-binding protein
MNANIVLEINNLKMYFPIARDFLHRSRGEIRAIDGISFKLHSGETLGICGESGAGKSTLARCINRLYNPTDGEILLEGVDISRIRESKLRKFRRKMSLVFQDPYSSLDPRQKIRDIVLEPIKVFPSSNDGRDGDVAIRLLNMVGLDQSYLRRYPHELSGGQRQRVGIARALASKSVLIIFDEPVSALDASIQAQIISLLRELHNGHNELTYIYISHDLSAIQYLSDRVAVMYRGRIVEIAETNELYRNTLHPYTQMLFSAASLGDHLHEKENTLSGIQDSSDAMMGQSAGCNFRHLCHYAVPECGLVAPPFHEAGKGHEVACIQC